MKLNAIYAVLKLLIFYVCINDLRFGWFKVSLENSPIANHGFMRASTIVVTR